MNDSQGFRLRPGVIPTLILSGVLPIALGLLVHALFGDQRKVLPEIHSAAESLGTFVALVLAALVLMRRKHDEEMSQHLWVACGLIGMGVLDSFHACVPPGAVFVWLHSVAGLAGGLMFAMVWLPDSVARSRSVARLPVLVAIASVALGAISIAFPGLAPEMIVQGKFTQTAHLVNILGGVFFLAAGVWFFFRYQETGRYDELVFSNLSLLFAGAGLLFVYSSPWNVDWWLWHVLRLVAFVIALGYVFVVFQRGGEETKILSKTLAERAGELTRINEALQGEIAERKRAEETIRELSTPVLRVRDEVLILPIIGILDSLRARQLTEQLLCAIRTQRAKVAVVDITGVAAVDSKVANHLLQTVEAARLMGATILITGLSPEVAQTLVTIGVDLSRIRTMSDLQNGIEEAERIIAFKGAGVERAAVSAEL